MLKMLPGQVVVVHSGLREKSFQRDKDSDMHLRAALRCIMGEKKAGVDNRSAAVNKELQSLAK